MLECLASGVESVIARRPDGPGFAWLQGREQKEHDATPRKAVSLGKPFLPKPVSPRKPLLSLPTPRSSIRQGPQHGASGGRVVLDAEITSALSGFESRTARHEGALLLSPKLQCGLAFIQCQMA